METGHGRSRARRELNVSTGLTACLDWPDGAQVCRRERTWREHRQPTRALHFGITAVSLDAGLLERPLVVNPVHEF
ncbi:MAG: hypothetical protein H0W06_08755 [Chloroflexia bacterium]|nr:hypothetical protein [Chloroflexia bacterium]